MKKIVNKALNFFLNPRIRFGYLSKLGVYNNLDDITYLKKKYQVDMNKKLDLNNPKTFNEKIQWLKLYNRKDEYTVMVDKHLVKDYVAKKIGAEYIIPTIGVWDSPEEIDFNALPEKFVLKCNHNSGKGMYICKDKSLIDEASVRKNLKAGLEQDYYLTGREWPYKNVPRKIIAEQYMEDTKTGELRDYKFFCFNGEAKIMFVASERQKVGEETKFDFFDMDYNLLPFTNGHPNAAITPEKPQNFDKMKELAEILAEGIPHARIDFYEINGKIFFGEITFSHWSGFVPFDPEEWDYKIGEWITLPEKTN